MSKPATQKVTAAVRMRMRGSREPRTAIQAAAGRYAESEAEHEVRPAGEALGVGVKEQDSEGDRGEPEGKAIQLGGGENKDGAGDDDESGDEGGREMAGGERAGAGAGIGGVDGGVGQAIEGHGGGTGG